jgi:ubiquinone/menaquinone biosynthesis C-methylase UbiE
METVSADDNLKKTTSAYDNLYKNYMNRHSSLDEILEELREFAHSARGGVVLDVGCAHGRDLRFFSGRGFKPIGIDLSRKLLHAARDSRVELLLMDMRYMGFRREVFDGLWVCASFLHIPKSDADRVLGEFHRILKTGCPMYLTLQQGEGERLVETEQGHVRFFAYYGLKQIKKLVLRNEFKIMKTRLKPKTNRTWLQILATK